MKPVFARCGKLRQRFLSSETGSVMVMGAFVIPVVVGATIFGIDHVIATGKIASLQRTADRTAIATAGELPFIKQDTKGSAETLEAIARNYAENSLPDADLDTTALREGENVVAVRLALTFDTPFNQIFGGEQEVTAYAKAESFGGQNICIISTETGRNNPGISLDNQAEIKAGKCGIYSNSSQPHSIRVRESAHIEANFICSAGGYEGGDGGVSTDVTTDCQQIRDPLESRPAPPVQACDSSMPRLIGRDENVTLSPGTYCGGLTIQSNANVEFSPGIYVFKEGPLLIGNEAVVAGENVGLYFEDAQAYFEFRDDAEIKFSAPETGPMAGIVISAKKLCADSACTSPRTFRITSAKVRSLLGTISLPQDDLEIDTTMSVSEDAAFTILIIDNLIMKQAPALILNTDYAATSVPVPSGFAGEAATRLVE